MLIIVVEIGAKVYKKSWKRKYFAFFWRDASLCQLFGDTDFGNLDSNNSIYLFTPSFYSEKHSKRVTFLVLKIENEIKNVSLHRLSDDSDAIKEADVEVRGQAI